MDSQAFKFTFYVKQIDTKKENKHEIIGKPPSSARHPSQPRPALSKILNPNCIIHKARPLTQRNQRIVIKPRSNSKSPIENSELEMLRSKSYLNNRESRENFKITKKNPKSCSILKLLPVLHHFKKPIHSSDHFLHSVSSRNPFNL